jgi:hypothetical protein
MNCKATARWLAEHRITLEQSFAGAVRELAQAHKKTTVSA